MEKLVKAILMNCACTLAAAVLGDSGIKDASGAAGGGLPIDPTIADTNIRNLNIEGVKEVEIYYAWLLQAYTSTGAAGDPFKDPPALAAPAAGQAVPGLADLVTRLSALASPAIAAAQAAGVVPAVPPPPGVSK